MHKLMQGVYLSLVSVLHFWLQVAVHCDYFSKQSALVSSHSSACSSGCGGLGSVTLCSVLFLLEGSSEGSNSSLFDTVIGGFVT